MSMSRTEQGRAVHSMSKTEQGRARQDRAG